MSHSRPWLGLLASGAVSLALLAGPLAALAESHEEETGSESPASVSEACRAENLGDALKNPGRLTLSTDIPAYPPWWGGDPAIQYPDEPPEGSGWELSDPYSGEGYEAAVAYATAAVLGFGADEVDWSQNTVWENAFQPGPKAFDWHMAQIAIKPERAEAVDFSHPYFDSNQSLVAMTGTPITEVTTLEDLKDFRLGAAVATTAFTFIENVIQPNTDISVLADNSAAVQALQNGQIDGIVADLYSAIYMRDVQLDDFDTPDPEATIVGQFGGGEATEQMGMVLEKDSPLTECVNEALAIVKESGQLQAIYDEWIGGGQDIPFFE